MMNEYSFVIKICLTSKGGKLLELEDKISIFKKHDC